MNREFLNTLKWVLTVMAYAYLVYKLTSYDRYDLVAANLRAMGGAQWLALGVCTLLMPLNMLIEAWRWQTLMPMPLAEAQRQVYYSRLAAIVTPWHLGEYPARGLVMNDGEKQMDKVLSMGAVGSATMTAAILILGMVGLFFHPSFLHRLGDSYLYALTGTAAVIGICIYFAPKWLHRWAQINGALLMKSVLQSAVRVLCWCVQLALTLYALQAVAPDDIATPSVWLQLPIYYLLVTITPNIPVVEAGVRGAWAIFLFGTPNAALAGVLLWAINTFLPCLCWLIVRKRT